MSSIVLKWNPRKWPWSDLAERLYGEPALSADELATEPFCRVAWFTQTPVLYVPEEVFAAVEDRLC